MLINLAAPHCCTRESHHTFGLNRQARPQSPIAHRPRRLDRSGRPLPFHRLTSYEPVSTQFAAWGVEFEQAIALYPSNPSFITTFSDLVLMPTSLGISIKLLRPLHSAGLRLRGHHNIYLQALDAHGQAVPHPKNFHYRYVEATKAPQETLILDLRRVRTLTLQSSSPFILESFSL